MKLDRGTGMRCPDYTKDILDTVRSKRRSKTGGVSVDKKQLTQNETLLLFGYLIVKDTEVYEKIINIDFPRELMNKLLKVENTQNV